VNEEKSGLGEPRRRRPNVLIIITDDQRLEGTMAVLPRTEAWFHLGGELSPGRSFEGGTFFPNGVVTTPLCSPSRASLLTGRYAHNHGTQQNRLKKDDPDVPWNAARGPGRFFQRIDSSLPVYLQGAGYRTGIFGRYFPLIDRFDSDLAPHPLPGWNEYVLISDIPYAGFEVNENGVRRWIARYSTDYIAAQAERFLDTAKADDDDRPWFLYLAPATPHSPYVPAPRHADASVPPLDVNNPAYFEADRRDKPLWVQTTREDADVTELAWSAYLRALRSADDLVDRVMQKLDELGETNTIAFYTADHGLLWGEHGLRWKEKPYLESIRVPFFMRWPEHVASNHTDDRLVANIDIAPTIVDAVNAAGEPRIDPSPPMDGTSLLEPGRLRTRILTEHFGSGPPLSSPRNFFVGTFPSWASMVTDSFQYVEYYRTYRRDPSDPAVQAEGDPKKGAATPHITDYGEVIAREYYDLESDPRQLTNLLAGDDAADEESLSLLHSLLAQDRTCGAPPASPCAQSPAGPSPPPLTPSRKSSESSCSGESPGTKGAGSEAAPAGAAGASRPANTKIRPSPAFSPNRTGATFYVGCVPGGGVDPRDVRFEGRLIVGDQPPPPFRPCGTLDASAPRNFVMKTFDGLESGTTYTFEARAIDLAGNVDPSPASFRWQVGPVQTFSSVPDLAAPDVAGASVQAIVPDGAGGWYVGGDFTAVGGIPRTNLAHIVEDAVNGSLVVDTEWAPVTDGAVTTMAIASGTLYVGGSFTSVAGANGQRDRAGLAALSAAGDVIDWDPQATDASPGSRAATVHALAVEPGPSPASIYAAGDFTRIGGADIEKIAKLDLESGKPDTGWNPDVLGGTIYALAVTEGHVYVGGGSISSIGGEPRNALAEIERLGRGEVTDWDPAPRAADTPIVYGLELRQGLGGLHTILVAGRFNAIGSNAEERGNAAEVNLADNGSVTSWDPQLGLASGSGSARATLPFFCAHPGEPIGRYAPMAADPTCSIIVGGEFDTVKTGSAEQTARSGLAETNRSGGDPSDTRSGSANDWHPNLDAAPLTISGWAPTARCDADPNRVLAVGGLFTRVGGAPRGRLAFFRMERAEA
jgi:arylsulfatase A-like enzyme